MDQALEYISNVTSHAWVIAFFAIALVIYNFACIKRKNLPQLPTKLLLVYLVLQFILSNWSDDIAPRYRTWIDVTATIAICWAISRLLFTLLVEAPYFWRKKAALPKITRDLVLLAAYFIFALVVLHNRGGVNLMGLVTTSAVLTAVIGLAAQNFLGNVFAGVLIQIEQPFQLGDWIQYGDYSGRVLTIGWEATRLETFDHETIFIPNLDICKSVLKNYSMPTLRHAIKMEVGVDYGASPNRVRKVLLEVCNQEPMVLKEPPPVVRLKEFGDFAVMYEIRLFYNDYSNYPDLKAAMMNRIWYALKRADIRIPFPISDVHLRHIERKFETEEALKFRNEARAKLDTVPILKPLSAEARDAIAKQMKVEEYGDGEAIVKQGDKGDSLFILHRGSCDVEVAVGDVEPSTVATLTPPAFFGEMSLLTGEPRSATVRARGNAFVFSVEKELFRDILIADPKISEELADALARRQVETTHFVGKRLDEQDRQASNLLNKIRSFFGIA